jgi:hypothetical protein
MGHGNRADNEWPDPLSGLPGAPVEMLGDGNVRLSDLAVVPWYLVRPGKPRGGVGRGIHRAARPGRIRRVAGRHVVAAEIETVIGMEVAQCDGIDLARVQVAIERTHGPRPAVDQEREDAIFVRRLHQVTGGW